MIPLRTNGIARGVSHDLLGKVSVVSVPETERRDIVRVVPKAIGDESLQGYVAILTPAAFSGSNADIPVVYGCRTDHLEQDDVVSITPQGHVRTLYRRSSTSNTLFATDRCNSFCIMCSQPPRNIDDSGRAEELIRLVGLIDPGTGELGITGGEPTLLGHRLLDVIAACRDRLPRTSIHLLSNGRRFYYPSYARALGALGHPNLMVGVPVYSDIDSHHDYVVQAKGAFDETIIGLQNLAQASVLAEIRVVIHRETYERLPQLAEYIYRNLTFASHVAFMGLEIIGFGKSNIKSLWIDPLDYAVQLEAAVLGLVASGMNVSIYNHQLCTLPRSVWPYSRRSISDWKNEYAPVCSKCHVKGHCGGFFAWNIKEYLSRGIRPVSGA